LSKISPCFVKSGTDYPSDFANQYPHGIELADDRGVWGREQPE